VVHYIDRVPTPADVLAGLIEDDASRPAMTFYDDQPGPTRGERIEISRKVLGTWVAKAANTLQEGFDAEPGTLVRLEIPVPHWRMVYWALAVWSVGATVTLDTSEGADVLVTTDPSAPDAVDADEVVAVALPALARSFGADLRTGVMDEAREISSFADTFTPWSGPEPSDTALVAAGERTSYADLVTRAAERTGPASARLLVTEHDPATFLDAVLGCLAARGSVVMVRGAEVGLDDPRMHSEGVHTRFA